MRRLLQNSQQSKTTWTMEPCDHVSRIQRSIVFLGRGSFQLTPPHYFKLGTCIQHFTAEEYFLEVPKFTYRICRQRLWDYTRLSAWKITVNLISHSTVHLCSPQICKCNYQLYHTHTQHFYFGLAAAMQPRDPSLKEGQSKAIKTSHLTMLSQIYNCEQTALHDFEIIDGIYSV